MAGLREKKQQERKERIHKAAIDLFASTGFEATTMAVIAERAELAVGTLYNYYRSKSELLLSIISDRNLDYLKELEARISSPGEDPVAAIMVFVDSYLRKFSVYPKQLWREFFGHALTSNIPFKDTIGQVDADFIEALANLVITYQKTGHFAERTEPYQAAMVIYNLLFSKLITFLLTEEMRLDHIRRAMKVNVELIHAGLAS